MLPRMTLGSHQQTIGKSQVHLTPKWIIDALGPFDLDPCAAEVRPWNCARANWTADGLLGKWRGLVWLNPPFHRYQVAHWLQRMAEHNNGIALLHARTETAWFQICWHNASAILFLDHRLTFCKADGTPCTTLKGEAANSGAPPVLVAFGYEAMQRLENSGITGNLVTRWKRI
jgi:hypothetical protein